MFIIFGAISILWLLPWRAATRHASVGIVPGRNRSAPSFAAILRRRAFWGTCLAHFCGLYSFYFVISWLPLYLVKSRGLTLPHMAEITGLIYIVYAGSTFLSGKLSDRAIAAGFSVNLVRKAGAVGGLAISTATLAGAAFGDTNVAIASLFCNGIASGMVSANVYTIPQTLAGRTAPGNGSPCKTVSAMSAASSRRS